MDPWPAFPVPAGEGGRVVSSDDDEHSPTGVRVVGGALVGSRGQVVRHVDSCVRSTRCEDMTDDEGSPRSRRLTFEFRNFNLYPDTADGERSPTIAEKRRPSRSLDISIPRVDEQPEYGYVSSPTYAHEYYGYGIRPPAPPRPHVSPPRTHPYRPTQRSYSDVGQGSSRGKKVVTLREAVPVPIRVEEDEGSSELSEPDDPDGPSKSGDSSTQRRRKLTRTRKKKPYKSRRCDICNKTFTKECDVTRHRRTAHGEDEIEFKCHECGRLFNRKDALERHYKVYEGTPHVARRYQPKTYLGQKK